MADLRAMTADLFYGSLQQLQAAAVRESNALNEQKLALQRAFTAARGDANPALAQARMAALAPIVHRNSALRLRYRDLVSKFNQIVDGVTGILRRVGINPPGTLEGLGQIQAVLIPVAWVAGLAIAWGIVHEITAKRAAIDRDAASLIRVANDDRRTPAERIAALHAFQELQSQSGGDWIKSLVPIAIAVAAIIVLPPIVRAVSSRRAAA